MFSAIRLPGAAVAASLLFATAPASSAEQTLAVPREAGFSSAGLARLDAYLKNEIALNRIPGAVLMIQRDGKTAYLESFGVRDPGTKQPMTPNTIFRIYSMSKPITTAAAMMLVEEGRLQLDDPLSKYIPAFAAVKVGVETKAGDGTTVLDSVPAKRPITIQDLMRHTSGITYGFFGEGLVKKAYVDAHLFQGDVDNAEFAERIARLPLAYQPGTTWDYSHSTDIVGRVVEIVSGQSLGAFLRARILAPLGMDDTGFSAPPDRHDRLAEPFADDPDTGEPVNLIETRIAPSFESGGGGLVSTIEDYARFLQMLSLGGALDGVAILGRKTIAFMAADHLGPEVRNGTPFLLPPGHGFGLGFAVRRQTGLAPTPGTPGEFFWGGIAGTAFWVAPAEELVALMMIQAPGRRDYYRQLFRNLVHAALA